MAGQGKRRVLEYRALMAESVYVLNQRVNESSLADWRMVMGSFQATTFGFFVWMEKFTDVAQG